MAKQAQNSDVKVWRIFRFKDRYELSDDIKICRKSGLLFTKRFVGIGGGDEAVGYQRQMAMICNGDGLEASLIEGLYGKLVGLASEQSYRRRGFLLSAGDLPLTDPQIAKMLNINHKTMGKYLRLFESVRLIERVDVPNFEEDSEEVPKIPEGSEKKSKPLKKRQPAKAGKSKRLAPQKATSGKTTTAGKEKNNGNGKKPIADKPCESDALGGDRSKPESISPPGSVKPASSRTRAGPVHHEGDYEKSDVFYGSKVYSLLKLRHPVDSPEAWREITSFASKFHECRCLLSGLPPPEIDKLGIRGLRQAEKIAKQKKANRSAVWNDFMDKIANAKAVKANDN